MVKNKKKKLKVGVKGLILPKGRVAYREQSSIISGELLSKIRKRYRR